VLTTLGAAQLQGSTLSGLANSNAGSTEDSGPFTATCSVNGSSRLDLQLSANLRTEQRDVTSGVPSGYWTDGQGNQHSMAGHNLFTPESWFCPAVAISRIVQASNMDIQLIGEESRNGATVEHFRAESIPSGTNAGSDLLVHLSQVDIYIDPETLRPVVLTFNLHPDTNASVDIPVEIRFSAYTQVGQVWTPMSIKRYVNGALGLDLEVQTASFK